MNNRAEIYTHNLSMSKPAQIYYSSNQHTPIRRIKTLEFNEDESIIRQSQIVSATMSGNGKANQSIRREPIRPKFKAIILLNIIQKLQDEWKHQEMLKVWKRMYSYSFRLDPLANADRLAEIERRLKKVMVEVLKYLIERRAFRAGWYALSNC